MALTQLHAHCDVPLTPGLAPYLGVRHSPASPHRPLPPPAAGWAWVLGVGAREVGGVVPYDSSLNACDVTPCTPGP